MAITVTVANEKGGCGKTTTAMNLAGGFVKAGYRVGVVDGDPQASASVWALAQGQGSLPFEVFGANLFGWSFTKAAAHLADREIVIFDTAPGVSAAKDEVGRFTRAAIAGAGGVLVPLQPSTLDFSAAKTFVRLLGQIKPATTPAALLLNGLSRNRLSRDAREVAEQLAASLPSCTVLEAGIVRRSAVTEVSGSGETIFDFRPSHPAAMEYAALTREVHAWLKNQPSARLT